MEAHFTHVHKGDADTSAALALLETVAFRLTLAVILTDGRRSAALPAARRVRSSVVNSFVLGNCFILEGETKGKENKLT